MIKESLHAARAQLVATLAVLDMALQAIEQQEQVGCKHDRKVDTSNLTTGEAWYCPDCGQSSAFQPAAKELANG